MLIDYISKRNKTILIYKKAHENCTVPYNLRCHIILTS